MNWTLEQLRTLAAIAEHGTMTAAARELGYTTGAVSQQMRALRGAIGREVFLRDGRRITLTDAGHLALRHAERILAADRAAGAAFAGRDGDSALAVRIGVFGSAAVVAVGSLVERLRGIEPAFVVHAHEVDVERMPTAVAAGEVDLALGVDYHAVPMPSARGITATRLLREPFLLAVPQELAGRCVGVDERLEFAASAPWILPPPTSFFGRATRLACAGAGIEPDVTHLVTDTAVALAMVASGIGVTLATPLMASLGPREGVSMAELPGAGGRDVVAYAKTAALERESVGSVMNALAEVFAGVAGVDVGTVEVPSNDPGLPLG